MKKDYYIKNLIKRFKIHAKYSEEEENKRRKQYLDEYNKLIPQDGPDPDFNISYALHQMCIEIDNLKQKIEDIYKILPLKE